MTQTVDDILTSLSNPEMERAFLNALLTYPERLRLVDLSPDELHDQRNRAIYEAIRAMSAKDVPIEEEAMLDHLKAEKLMNAAEWFPYLTVEVMARTAFVSSYPEDYAPALSELSTRRRAFRSGQDFLRSVMDRAKAINDTLNEFSARIPKLVKTSGGAQHIGVYASRYYDYISEAIQNPELAEGRKLRTGYLDFDAMTGGLHPGEMMLVYGRPGLGKTKWVHQMGAQLAANGYPGVIYQMETSENEIMEREFSREGRIDSEHLENVTLAEEEITSFSQAFERMGDESYPLYLDFTNRWNTVTLRADLTRLKAERGVRWFVLDYLRFLRDTFGKDETERENYISSQLKSICKELDLAGIVIHSMNKSGMSAESPELEHGSGGAGISFDCDKALFMVEHTPESGLKTDRFPHYRTFVMRKSRRRIKFSMFHMQAVKNYPAFVDVARPDREPPPVRTPKAKPPKPNPADLEIPDMGVMGDIE